jgi:hypothetical protein
LLETPHGWIRRFGEAGKKITILYCLIAGIEEVVIEGSKQSLGSRNQRKKCFSSGNDYTGSVKDYEGPYSNP